MYLGEIDNRHRIFRQYAALVDALEVSYQLFPGVDLRILVPQVVGSQGAHGLDPHLVKVSRVEFMLGLTFLAHGNPDYGSLGIEIADIPQANGAGLGALHEHLLVLGGLEVKCHHDYAAPF